ncbi:MAG: 5-formyltetrahydrofolate cyclo-ligase [Gammaproteobacteria bacterium]|nr:5-formyltetrahydrofolate cyclo-ligase [Gammaproteobacteria bacterium]
MKNKAFQPIRDSQFMQQNKQVSQQKAETRKMLKTARAKLPEATRLDYSNSITEQVLKLDEIRNAKTIFIYISYASEVYTHDLVKTLLEDGKTLAVPKIVDSDFMEAESLSSWEDLIPGELGILTPANSKPCNGPFDIALTPGLGFTLSGHRMGFGRGYYDKWFAQNEVKHKIALAFEAQLVDEIPIEDTDVPMEKIVTEQRVITI